ncbi:hypothetical protein F4778DRAFT_756139 [Xylariomycetidae sp. FL2044]|nr:hypothetical protein F4778DRAFT_756139 [Xylariomycetidae sp. FL2044]
MLLRGKSKERTSPRKVTPPSPAYMNNDQFAAYLAGLRDSRNSRPGGARPQPPSMRSNRTSLDRFSTGGRPSLGAASVQSDQSTSQQRTQSDAPKPRSSRPSIAGSVTSRYSTVTSSGRDYYPEKTAAAPSPLKPSDVVPSATYIERGQRWMEKEEAVSLRQAMEDMDLKNKPEDEQVADDESRVYDAALNEAAELVWQHQHGIKPPEPGAPYRYKPHLRKNSYAHARAASAGQYGDDIGASGLARDSTRSFSGSSSGSDRASSPGSRRSSMEQHRNFSGGSTRSKPYGSSGRVASGGRRRSSMKRNVSGEIEKPFSGDQIWEEPEGNTPERNPRQPRMPAATQPLGLKTRNQAAKVQFAPDNAPKSAASPASSPTKPLSRFEIHKNPPSQSRNPNYTSNNSPFNSPRASSEIPTKNGVELRSDDIRQATSMRLSDRSPKLPTPSAVSDSPGRPIVSFDKQWKAPEEATDSKPEESTRVPLGVAKERPGQNPPPAIPSIAFTPAVQAPAPSTRPSSTPLIPSIQIDGDDGPQVPVISVSDDSPTLPTIVLPDDDNNDDKNSSPSIPVIVAPDDNKKPAARPLPDPKSVQPHLRNARADRPRGHWSPAPGAVSRRATAICHECNFPIEGRFVSLRGVSERFHPQCFRCYTCGTGLEALEISPEPDHFREARLDRIRRRAAGEVLDEEPGQTMAEDGDERLRFYCHLDWHELYAPRCRHCKTPILGEHIVALGGQHYHHGHFFCAECGDPFERGATHIEKDGYAWCVNCQTKRTERRAPKCRACRRAVIGQYVQALGAEWHDECFRCAECRGGFDDGQIFPMEDEADDTAGEGPGGSRKGRMYILCTGCRARGLKM